MVDNTGRKQPHPFYPDRWADGTVRLENQAARKHGVDSAAVRRGEVPHELRQSIEEFRAGLNSDQGGPSELTTVRAGYITRLCDIEVCCRLLQNDLVTRGVFTPKGRVRSTYDKFLATIDRWDRLAQRVGVDRRAKPIRSLHEYLEQRQDEQGKQRGVESGDQHLDETNGPAGAELHSYRAAKS